MISRSHSLYRALVTVMCLFSATVLIAGDKLTLTALEIPDIQRGAGLAIVIQTPSGKTFLYDTGSAYPDQNSSDGWQGNLQSGRDLILPLLKQRKIEKIDAVFISHAHYDHFGGLLWLKDHFPIDLLVDCGYLFQKKNQNDLKGTSVGEIDHYTQVREEFKSRGKYRCATAGEFLALDPDLKIEVIAPPDTYFQDHQVDSRTQNDGASHYLVNANSLMLTMKFRNIQILFPGDIQTEDIELSLLPFVDHAKLKCDLLICPGHGIHRLPEQFVAATRPEVSIASVFPRYARGIKSTPTLKAMGVKTYITGLHGDIHVVCDGDSLVVTTKRDDTVPSSAETSK